ncbi:MAG: S8 family serine peptidase [Defluviitaleaceae bacterium]|nr:S8 family serine peptidase [Defluviitaleaceae bacterium]
MSFGGGNSPFTAFTSAVNVAVEAGVVVVSSAGNSGPGSSTVTSPGSEHLIITVGNGIAGGISDPLGISDTMRDTSSRGPIMLTYHIKPDIIAPGTNVRTANIDGGYTTTSGTSLSAPVIAGIAALLIEAFPNDTPYEIKARIMNTARPMAGAGANNVFISGAGFVRPFEALTTHTIVTVEHGVPISNIQTAEFVSRRMSSLSFGSVAPRNNTMPLQIENRGTTSRVYAISHTFNNNPDNAASLSFDRTNVVVAAGGTENIVVTLNFEEDASFGFYEGYVLVSTGGTVIARLPFAANLTETVSPAVTIDTPNLEFDGISFALGTIQLSASNAFRGNSVLVEIRRHTADGSVSNVHTNRAISAGGTININPSSSVNTFNPQYGEYIEINVFRNNIRQHLLHRQIIHPVVFSFD